MLVENKQSLSKDFTRIRYRKFMQFVGQLIYFDTFGVFWGDSYRSLHKTYSFIGHNIAGNNSLTN
jgi:hypothetical protein